MKIEIHWLDVLLQEIKLIKQFDETFRTEIDWIISNDIVQIDDLLFNQIYLLSFEAFEEFFHHCHEDFSRRYRDTICVKSSQSLSREHNKGG